MNSKPASLPAILSLLLLAPFLFSSCFRLEKKLSDFPGENEHEAYDGPMEIGLQEFEKTKDPALGYVPAERLWSAMAYTEELKQMNNFRTMAFAWTERGPIYDLPGPFGNSRATASYTSGRMRAILVDASDATGNTVFVGGVNGGVWRTTNFLSSPATWTAVNDYFANMAVTSICQNPANPDIMYFSTGEATSNSDAVFGRGVWKSTDHGLTWTQLPSTVNYWRCFKIACDASGNVYLALRTTGAPLPTQNAGLVRSTDGGSTWTDITPTGLTSSNSFCTDIELSSTGRLHASFGYATGAGGVSNYRFTDNPSTVTAATWTSPTSGLPTAANRIEFAVQANTLYAAPTTTDGNNNVVQLYRSNDGGATWTLQNGTNYTTAIINTQGWYNLTLGIDPNNVNNVILGGLDAYRSTNSGSTMSRMSYWAGATPPYVHADHHFLQWYIVGAETRIIIGCDGGIFLSRDNGATFQDRNRNLSLKQFFSVALHPASANYMLAGAQDNGSHALNGAGLTSSTEVTGGDGAYVHIDQNQSQYQFTSYVRNQYRRSTDGGSTWTNVNFSSTLGLFINPTDYDNTQNMMYCSYGSTAAPNNQVLRWSNPQSGSTNVILTLAALTRTSNSNATALTVSPYTANRVYIGSSRGVLVRLDNANTVTAGTADANTTAIGSASFPVGTINCVEVGTNDNNLVAVFSNYGVSNVWVTSDGGTSWTAVDGNLPDMPVRWALFEPGSNNRLILATEAGIYTTSLLNGASTVWTPSPGFPTVRTDMLQYRSSDGTLAAATHGRGLFTANILAVLPLKDIHLTATAGSAGKALLNWTATGAEPATKFRIQYSTDGVRFTQVAEMPSTVLRYEHAFAASTGYYRVMGVDDQSAPVFSNTVSVKNTHAVKGIQLKVLPNPVVNTSSFELSTPAAGGNYTWKLLSMDGMILQTGKGSLPEGGRIYQRIDAGRLASGTYRLQVVINNQPLSTSFVKL